MLKKFAGGLAKIALPVFAVVVIGYLIYAFITGAFPFGANGQGQGEVIAPEYSQEEEEEPKMVEEEPPVEEPPSLIIEISEDRIIYDGEVISLGELEEVLRRYASIADIWELHDVYRAHRATYESVRELLRRHDIAYRER